MKKFIIGLLTIFETIFYTFFMILLSEFKISNPIFSLLYHFGCLTLVSLALYYIIRFIWQRLGIKAKKYIYLIAFWNVVLGIIFPILMVIIIPNATLISFAIIVLIATIYYGIFVNILLVIFNYLLTNRRKA